MTDSRDPRTSANGDPLKKTGNGSALPVPGPQSEASQLPVVPQSGNGNGHLADFKQNPNSQATQWKPGQSGNPAGRPKGVPCLNYWMKKFLLGELDRPKTPKERAMKRMMQRIVDRAMTRSTDTAFCKFLDKIMADATQKAGEGISINNSVTSFENLIAQARADRAAAFPSENEYED